MRYHDGQPVALGDRVKLWNAKVGTIVCSIDDGAYTTEFAREDWANLGRGVLIRADDGEVFHYLEPDEDFELLARARQAS